MINCFLELINWQNSWKWRSVEEHWRPTLKLYELLLAIYDCGIHTRYDKRALIIDQSIHYKICETPQTQQLHRFKIVYRSFILNYNNIVLASIDIFALQNIESRIHQTERFWFSFLTSIMIWFEICEWTSCWMWQHKTLNVSQSYFKDWCIHEWVWMYV